MQLQLFDVPPGRELVKGPRPALSVEVANAVTASVALLREERGEPPVLLLPPGITAAHLKLLDQWARDVRRWLKAPRDERGRVKALMRRPVTSRLRARLLQRVAYWAAKHGDGVAYDAIQEFARATLAHLEGTWEER